MPEIKHQFMGGKMNKDNDERLVPNGEYRDAMNIQVATSEDSDVGTAQNVLGNEQIFVLIPNDSGVYDELSPLLPLTSEALVLGAISDEKVDTMYYLVWTPDADYILSWRKGDASPEFIFVDLNKDVLKFPGDKIITGINIIDGLLFWTDNVNEPRKINVQRCKEGTVSFANQLTQTQLRNNMSGLLTPIEEKHITVIKKGPQVALDMELHQSRDPKKIYTAVIEISPTDDGTSSFLNEPTLNPPGTHNFSGLSTEAGSNRFAVEVSDGLNSARLERQLTSVTPGGGPIEMLDGMFKPGAITLVDKFVGQKVVIQAYNDDGTPPGLPLTDFVIRGVITDVGPIFVNPLVGGTLYDTIVIEATSIDGTPPLATDKPNLKYVIDLFDESEKLFEFKYPRFSYRYKFEDGEYSTFAPFTQVAFIPGPFDYHPRKGYNIGMTNRLSKVELFNAVTSQTPDDVVAVDILFKDDASPSIYIVDTIKPNDYVATGDNMWNSMKASSATTSIPETPFVISIEAISSILPSNQLLRPYDNVPKRALAQDITGNRIVYANYTQNYDLMSLDGNNYIPNFSVGLSNGFSDSSKSGLQFLWEGTALSTSAFKSIKSLREYQLGVVFLDEFGRETPVLSNSSGTVKVDKALADKANRFEVQFNSDDYPQTLTHFKFFVKETSSEYYNMAMDRWYSAGDNNIWLAFPSSDRNKIDIDTFLILKKGSDQDTLVTEAARYKVLAIENEAPDFIKTTKRKAVIINHIPGTTKDLFGTGASDAPFEGFSEFKMNYEPFFATSGRNLVDSEDELYVEFGKVGSDELSERYKIVSIAHDFDADSGTPLIPLSDSKYTVQLETPLGNDVNFITDDPSGVGQSKIETNAIVNIYKYKVENLDRFDGRFFVKIYFDEVFRNNIESTLIGGGKRVASSRKVYSMKSNMVKKHTAEASSDTSATRFLTKGKGFDKTSGNWKITSPTGMGDIAPYGYYNVDEFTAHALYFRKYTVKDYDFIDGIGVDQNILPILSNTLFTTSSTVQTSLEADVELNTNGFQVLVHLKDTNGSTTTTSIPNVNYPNSHNNVQEFVPADDWHLEFGYHTNAESTWHRATRNFDPTHSSNQGLTGMTSNWEKKKGSGGPLAQDVYWYHEDNTSGAFKSDVASAQNNEVWFIDEGQSAGKITSTTNYELNIKTNEQDYKYSDGIKTPVAGGDWSMELAFGGLIGATAGASPHGFWNVGNWNGPGGNNNYDDGFNADFISRINSGYKFRWKEDPTKTEYVLGGAVSTDERMRHSHGPVLQGLNTGPLTEQDSYKAALGSNLLRSQDLNSMAEKLSFNMTKQWGISGISPALAWNPMQKGEITNGLSFSLDSVLGPSGNVLDFSSITDPLKIYVSTITTTDSSNSTVTLHEGMALKSFIAGTGGGTVLTSDYGGLNNFLVVRKINPGPTPAQYYELILGGYNSAIDPTEYISITSAAKKPAVNVDTYNFVQVGMNGYSQNSEFNFNTVGRDFGTGAIGAVGYTLEWIDDIQPTEVLSENPAIWETEPKDLTPLDVYYEACGSVPMSVDADNISDAFPLGTKFAQSSLTNLTLVVSLFYVVGYDEDRIIVENSTQSSTGILPLTASAPAVALLEEFFRPDDLIIKTEINSVTALPNVPGSTVTTRWVLEIEGDLVDNEFSLPWHNCYSFANGVESNRIRDNFNAPFISNGVKASTTLEQEYKEEHRKYGLIYSGIYNSISGINNLNQFIQAEKITKDINPKYGSIQKLYSRDSDLVTLCEDKILRISANKDALFNADGNPQLIATDRVLGQTIPFTGEYGISTNPESFASESYRAYFTDRVRGVVLRLSKDGLTPISDSGMKDWFRDNLKDHGKLVGSFDDRNDEYNINLTNNNIVFARGFIPGKGKTIGNTISLHPPLDDGIWIKLSVWNNIPNVNAIIVGSIIEFTDPNTGDKLVPIGTTITSIEKGLTLQSSLALDANGDPIATSSDNYVKIQISNLIVNQTTGVAPIYPRYLNPDNTLNNVFKNIDIGSGFMNFGELVNFRITQTGLGPNKLLSFSEKVNGWVSFKSFESMQMGISLANDYYTFDKGNLYLHYSENQDRNTFYSVFTPSSLNVILNADPGSVKVFNTLNYEGSQSKVDKFTSSSLALPLQPSTVYNDQEYYNLSDKPGWFVESITTNKEEGYVNEFLDKEGKWFNNINKTVDTNIKADTCDFTFQGIGFTSAGIACVDVPGNPIVTGRGVCSSLIAASGVVLDLKVATYASGIWLGKIWEYLFDNPTLTYQDVMWPALIDPTQSTLFSSNDPNTCMVDPSEPGYVTGEINQWVRPVNTQSWQIYNGNVNGGQLNPIVPLNNPGPLPIGSTDSSNATRVTPTSNGAAIDVIDKMIALYNTNYGGNYVQGVSFATFKAYHKQFQQGLLVQYQGPFPPSQPFGNSGPDPYDTTTFGFMGMGPITGTASSGGGGTVCGCIDITATNYNPLATQDDGSCLYPDVKGCTDDIAFNYDPIANVDDGSCCCEPLPGGPISARSICSSKYPPCDIPGCTDSIFATNYNPLATIDDGSCIAIVYGCTDPIATNYYPGAGVDDGSCTYVVGCTDPTATNYDPLAVVDDGSCIIISATPINNNLIVKPRSTGY